VPHENVVAVGNGYGPVDVERAPSETGVAAAPEPGAASVLPPVPGSPAPATAGSGAPAAGPAATGPKPSAGPTAATVDASRCPAPLSPIRLGQTLASSGLVGASIGGLRTGVAVWARDVNARGGVQCHPVEVTALDDASDASRVSANWNTLVHVRGSVAIIGAGTPLPVSTLVTAAERDKVPVIGTDLQAEQYYKSPYIFPQGGLPLTSYDGAYLLAAQAVGGGTAGLFYCVEVSICAGLKANHPKAVERAGLKPGPVTAISLTQPDYAAECQTMKQAGVTVLFVAADGSASIRVARSCISIGLRPAIASSAIALSALASSDKNLRELGAYLGTNNVPFMSYDSPAAGEFRAAMARYSPQSPLDEPAIFGWASGKLFEAAMAKVAAKARVGDVTTAMVLEGLWQLKNEKLGGLGPGVTFAEGKAPLAADCFYGVALGPNGFTDPIGSKPKCFGTGAPVPAAPESAGTTPAIALAGRRS
jgi:branched-chain amino acid transport system substrate-binding protein